jgi:Tol biopolymer transport system component
MRLPIIPIVVATVILGTVVYLFNTTGGERRTLDAPRMSMLTDVEGIETEVALSPDGQRAAVISDGNLWIVNLAGGTRSRLTDTPEAESGPAWTPDGQRITFTRGADTFVLPADASTGTGELFKADATDMDWSSGGRVAFIRNRGLWLSDVAAKNDKEIVGADENPNVTLHAPRFSPDSLQLAYIKSLLNLTGQIWTVDVLNGTVRTLVADRPTENPLDVGWIMEGLHLVYLTNRAGAYSLWHIDFAENTIMPLTHPLFGRPLGRIGMGTWKDRIVLPRHLLDSNIELSDGSKVVQSENVELEPAVSRDGKLVAYTVLKENRSEIWTADIDGSNPTFRTVGHEPRFTTDRFHLLYTHSDLKGNEDIWEVDLRNGATERVTDADEIDVSPDTSPDGRLIAFASTRGVSPSVWIMPASGGKRLRINDGGYAPRFSWDSRSIVFWNKGEFWIMGADGTELRSASLEPAEQAAPAVWSRQMPLQVKGNEIRGPNGSVTFKSDRLLWPRFDVMPDGRFLIAPVNILETGLWALDLQFLTQ